jgi:hypothetical protein
MRGGRGRGGGGAAPVFQRPIPKFLQKYSAQLQPLGRPLGSTDADADDGPTIVGGSSNSRGHGNGSKGGVVGKEGSRMPVAMGTNDDEEADEAAHVADALEHATVVELSAALPVGKRGGKTNAKVTFDEMMARSKGKSFSSSAGAGSAEGVGTDVETTDNNGGEAQAQTKEQIEKALAEAAAEAVSAESATKKLKYRPPPKAPRLTNSTLLSFDDEEEDEDDDDQQPRRKSRGRGRRANK